MFKFLVSRNGDSWRLRKVLVELYHNDRLVDRRRMFPVLWFAKRLQKKQRRMLRLAGVMVAASWATPKKEGCE